MVMKPEEEEEEVRGQEVRAGMKGREKIYMMCTLLKENMCVTVWV